MILTILILLALIAAFFWPEKEVFGNFLSSEITTIENYIEDCEAFNSKVSKGTVGWHLDHSLLVVGGVYKQLEESNPALFKKKFNKIRTLVFTINGIPRGRGKSPDRVRPKDSVTREEILDHFKVIQDIAYQFDALPSKSYFDHPYFGMLNRQQTKKFIGIHTRHHLKIIKDILKN